MITDVMHRTFNGHVFVQLVFSIYLLLSQSVRACVRVCVCMCVL